MKHSAKQKCKKVLCLFLAIVMLTGALPLSMIHVAAAGNVDTILGEQDGDVYSEEIFQGKYRDVFDALGFDTSVMPEGYDPDTVDNPFGRDKVVGNQVFEVLVTSQNGTGLFGKDNNDLTYADIDGDATSGLQQPFSLFAGAAADFDGDGLAGEVVYVGFLEDEISRGNHEGRTPLYLMVYDAKTGESSGTVSLGTTNPAQVTPSGGTALSQYDYAWQNFLQVTAGDYDGDGMHEVAVYVPEHGNVRVDIYKFQKTSTSDGDDWLTIDNWERVWTYVLSNSDGQIPNMVSLVSADINRDGIDDLGISYGRFASGYNKVEEFTQSKALLLWGSRTTMLQSTSELDLNDSVLGALTRVSLTTGDLDGDGYKELIATGHPMSDLEGYFSDRANGINAYATNTTRTVTTYIYDSEQGLLINQSEMLKPVDGSATTYQEGDQTLVSWSSGNGFDGKNYSQPLMRTNAAVIRFEGYDYPYLYLDSYLYEFIEGKLVLKMSLDEEGNVYDGTNTLQVTADTANGHWGVSKAENSVLVNGDYAEFGVISGDINGKGYDLLMTGFFSDTSLADNAGNHSHNSALGILSSVSDGTLAIKVDNNDITKDSDTLASTEHRYPLMVDADMDTIIMEYTGIHYLEYSDPQIVAVLAAAPYFEDVERVSGYDYAWQNVTGYSKTKGSGDGDMEGLDFEGGAFSDKEVTLTSKFLLAELAVMFTLEYNDETTKVTEYTLTFEAEQDQDSVAFFSVPTEVYVYNVYTPGQDGEYVMTKELITNQFEPVKQILTLDYYESIQESYKELPQIKGTILTSTPGDPSSYPSSTAGYNVVNAWNQEPAGVSFGTGTITQEITFTEENVKSHNFGAALDYKIGLGFDFSNSIAQSGSQFAVGAQFSLNPTGGDMDIDLEGTTISGSVANMPEEFRNYGYYFNWKLFSYSCSVNGSTFPVVSYIVNDVSEPPSLPKDFQQDYDRSTDSTNVLTWTYNEAFSSFKIYKYFDFPVGGGLQLVAEIPSDTADYRVKYDDEGKPYREYYYEDTNLAAYTEYQYAIQVERLSKIPPLSSPSELISVRTKAQYGNPLLTVDESDGENDGKLRVYPDKTVHMIASVTGPDGEAPESYYTVVQYQWQKKENDRSPWVDIVGETQKTLSMTDSIVSDEGEYRCRVNVITNTDATAISVYTSSVMLDHVMRSSYIEEAYVQDVSGGGYHLYAKVVNAHTDSASIPSGTVVFTLTDTATGRAYTHVEKLLASGVASVTLFDSLPEGTYVVTAEYSGSKVFLQSEFETLYLSQLNAGLHIGALSSITYGDGGDVVFRSVTKQNGITSYDETFASAYALYKGDQLYPGVNKSGTWVNEGDSVVKGNTYNYVGNNYMQYTFVASQTGTIEIYNTHVIYKTGETFDNYITYTNIGGKYALSENIPAGDYVLLMYNAGAEMASVYFKVERRMLTMQLPDRKGGEGTSATGDTSDAPAVYIGELTLIEGEWATVDLDENGELLYEHWMQEVAISYINTAGTAYDKGSVDGQCGYYIMRANASNDTLFHNYEISFLDGSYIIIGATQEAMIGVRPFENQQVGTVYAVMPEYGYTREDVSVGELGLNQSVGTRVVITAVPDNGYEVYDWYINGVAQGSKSTTFAYVMLAEDVTIEVQFIVKRNILSFGTAGDTEGGTITVQGESISTDSAVLANTHYVFVATAKDGYHFKEWRYTEQDRGTVYDDSDYGKDSSTFDFLMPAVSASVYAVFERDFYTVTFEDLMGTDGLAAYYYGSLTSDVTAAKERIYINSGDQVKGDTTVIVAPKPGYSLHEDYNFVSTGSRGTADYENGTFTFVIGKDTHVTAYTVREAFDIEIDWDMDDAAANTIRADDTGRFTLTYTIDSEINTADFTSLVFDGDTAQFTAIVCEAIAGGNAVNLEMHSEGRIRFDGFWTEDTSTIAVNEYDSLAVMVSAGDPVEKGTRYYYEDSSSGVTVLWYFTAPATGTLYFEAETVRILQFEYMIDALSKNEIIHAKMSMIPKYTISLPDISQDATITASYAYGSRLTEGENGLVYEIMQGDTLTLTVLPMSGKTLSQWKVESEGQLAYVPATGLKYVLPSVSYDVILTPVFVGGVYSNVTWPTISESQNGLTIIPESGYLTTLSNGSEFKFTIDGHPIQCNLIMQVYANGRPFVEASEDEVGNYVYETVNGKTVYTIRNIQANTEITLSSDDFGVYVNGVDLGKLNDTGWEYDFYENVLYITKSNLTLRGTLPDFASGFRLVLSEEVDHIVFDGLNLEDSVTDKVGLEALAEELTITLLNSSKITGDIQIQDILNFRGTGSVDFNGNGGANKNAFDVIALNLHDFVDVTMDGYTVTVNELCWGTEEETHKEAPTLRVNNSLITFIQSFTSIMLNCGELISEGSEWETFEVERTDEGTAELINCVLPSRPLWGPSSHESVIVLYSTPTSDEIFVDFIGDMNRVIMDDYVQRGVDYIKLIPSPAIAPQSTGEYKDAGFEIKTSVNGVVNTTGLTHKLFDPYKDSTETVAHGYTADGNVVSVPLNNTNGDYVGMNVFVLQTGRELALAPVTLAYEPLNNLYTIKNVYDREVEYTITGHVENYSIDAVYKDSWINKLTLDHVLMLRSDSSLNAPLIKTSWIPVSLTGNNYLVADGAAPMIYTDASALYLEGTGNNVFEVLSDEAPVFSTNANLDISVSALRHTVFDGTELYVDGSGINQAYYWKDVVGNNIKFTNAWAMDVGTDSLTATRFDGLSGFGPVGYMKLYATSYGAQGADVTMDLDQPDKMHTFSFPAVIVTGTVLNITQNSDGTVPYQILDKNGAVVYNDYFYPGTSGVFDEHGTGFKTVEGGYVAYANSGFYDFLLAGTYTVRIGVDTGNGGSSAAYTGFTLHILRSLTTDAGLVVDAEGGTDVTVGDTVTLTATALTDIIPNTYKWYIDGVLVAGATGTIFEFTVPADAAKGTQFRITAESYDGDTRLGYYDITLTVANTATGITISTTDVTADTDGNYTVHVNPDGEDAVSMHFEALVTLLDGSEADLSKLTWTLWGNQRRATVIDADGNLTISSAETGTDGIIQVIAIYTDDGGNETEASVTVRINTEHSLGEATCTEQAVCGICGEKYGETDSQAHTWTDGVCSACGKLNVTFVGSTITLNGNIGLNFYLDLDSAIVNSENAFVRFTLANSRTIEIPVSEGVVNTKVIAGKTLYVFTCEVYAKQMADTITAQVVMGENTSDEYLHSVVNYANAIIANESGAYTAETVALVKAMLNYGATAQTYFGYNTDNLANASLTDEEKDISSVTADTLASYKATGTTIDGIGTFAGSTLVLESETTLKAYFKLAEGVKIEDITFTVGTETMTPVKSGGYYVISITNITSFDLEKVFEVSVTDGTTSGTFQCSVFAYCYNVLNDTTGTYTDELKDTLKALYLYNAAANEYKK